MIDVSHNIPQIPAPDVPLDYNGANAIEWNLHALIRAWPAFESEQAAASVSPGADGYATPARGIEITFVQNLPRLLVILGGEGLENVAWRGKGWTEEAPGTLAYTMSEVSADNANAALSQLWLGAAGDADLIITAAGENLGWGPDGLRLVGTGTTKISFRGVEQ